MRTLLLCLVIATSSPACKDEPPGSVPTSVAPLDLNRATMKDLEALPAIGDKLARSIIASRNARGGRFSSIEQLLEIDGIGEKRLAEIRPYLYVR